MESTSAKSSVVGSSLYIRGALVTCSLYPRTLQPLFDNTVIFRVLRYYASVLEVLDLRDEHGEAVLEGQESTNGLYYYSMDVLALSYM